MSKGSGGSKSSDNPKIADRSREGELFPAKSIDEYAAQAIDDDLGDDNDGLICNWRRRALQSWRLDRFWGTQFSLQAFSLTVV